MLRLINGRHFNYLTENIQKDPFEIHGKSKRAIKFNFKNLENTK